MRAKRLTAILMVLMGLCMLHQQPYSVVEAKSRSGRRTISRKTTRRRSSSGRRRGTPSLGFALPLSNSLSVEYDHDPIEPTYSHRFRWGWGRFGTYGEAVLFSVAGCFFLMLLGMCLACCAGGISRRSDVSEGDFSEEVVEETIEIEDNGSVVDEHYQVAQNQYAHDLDKNDSNIAAPPSPYSP